MGKRQMLENKAPEHQKLPQIKKGNFVIFQWPRNAEKQSAKMPTSEQLKKKVRISRERRAPNTGSTINLDSKREFPQQATEC
jgi:hypothetical protein